MDNSEDIIDSRDVEKRIDELSGELEAHISDWEEARENFAADPTTGDDYSAALIALADWLEIEPPVAAKIVGELSDFLEVGESENSRELRALISLKEEGEGCGDWRYGEALIRESYFVEYAKQLAEDIGAISGKETWPLACLDWEQAADELKQDYTELDFDGVSYYIRS
jgi:hypothetical protein